MLTMSQRVSDKIRFHLEHIMEYLPGTKLTLVARNPLQAPGTDDIIVSADNLQSVIDSLEWQRDVQMQRALAPFRVEGYGAN